MSRRQDPVSCALCRRKKLRCSRQVPCSNCVARRVPCERECGLPTPNSTVQGALQGQTPAQAQTSNELDVLGRLQRLEALLTRVDHKLTVPSLASDSSAARLQRLDELLVRLEHRAASSLSPNVHDRPAGLSNAVTPVSLPERPECRRQVQADAAENAHTSDTRDLESVGTKDNTLLFRLSDELHYYITDLSTIVSNNAFSTATTKAVLLPLRSLAIALLDVYTEYIEFLHHLTYTPHVYHDLNQAYDAIESNDGVIPGTIALLLTIFASSMALQAAISRHENLLGIDAPTAQAATTVWVKAAFDCLDHSRRLGLGNLADLQATSTVFFLMYSLEGFSSRSRAGIGSALALAKELGLHRIDHPSNVQTTTDRQTQIETEVKRRVWWHLTATDWQLGVSGGPHEGTYNINPQHIATNLPRHIEEADLETKSPTFSRPLTTPTASSYLIQRIKLATVCRKITDTMPLGSHGADSIRYQDLLTLDASFAEFIASLPPFFHDDPTTHQQFQSLYTTRPSILLQKYTVNMITQTRRCRLHQPYLVRGFTDPRYAHSRDVCLESARTVIRIKHEIDAQHLTAAGLMSLSGIHHHMFFAAVALVMDLCFNKFNKHDQEGVADAKRRAEVADALQILDNAKDRSPVAKRFLESLMGVMRKHKVRLIDTTVVEAAPLSSEELLSASVIAEEPPMVPDFDDPMIGGEGLAGESDFDEIWQSYIEHGPNFEAPDWDSLFNELQTQL